MYTADKHKHLMTIMKQNRPPQEIKYSNSITNKRINLMMKEKNIKKHTHRESGPGNSDSAKRRNIVVVSMKNVDRSNSGRTDQRYTEYFTKALYYEPESHCLLVVCLTCNGICSI